MKAIAILAGLALAALGSGAAAKPVPDKSLNRDSSFVRSVKAVATIDVDRLFRDKDYARATAAHLDALERSGRSSEEQLIGLAALRAPSCPRSARRMVAKSTGCSLRRPPIGIF